MAARRQPDQPPGDVVPGRGRATASRLVRSGIVTLAALALASPAKAQSLDELKQQIEALQKNQVAQQKRIEQLESALRHAPKESAQAPRPAKPAAVARAAPRIPANREAAQEAAEQARQSAQEAQRAAAQAEQTASRAKEASAEAVSESFTPPPGRPPGTFRIPNTGVSVRIYGQVKLNGLWDLDTFNRADGLTAQAIPLSGSSIAQTGGFQANARRSRFGFEAWAPTDTALGDVRTLVEMDFAGQTTDLTTQSTGNSYTPRLRRAFAEFGQPAGWGVVLLGQENSLFNEFGMAFPLEWLADWTPGGMSGVRQGQVRYTYGFGNGITASAAVENGYPDIATSTGISFPDLNGGAGVGFTNVPDFTARFRVQRDWGQFALRGLVRPQMELRNQGSILPGTAFAKGTSGWGIGATGNLDLFDDRVILMGTANYGDGIGRYLDATSNGFGAVSNAGLPGIAGNDVRLNAVRVSGGLLGLQLNYTDNLRSNASLFGALLDYPSYVNQFAGCAGTTGTGTCNLVNRSLWGGSINLIWSPVRMIDLGVEYQHIERSLQTTNATGNKGGTANRIQVSGIVRY